MMKLFDEVRVLKDLPSIGVITVHPSTVFFP